MSWAKIDDRLWSHPKFLGLSLSAAGLWLFGLSYAASLERDGWFPGDALSRLTVTPDCESSAHELVHAGLWLREPDGYRIHDFLKYNFSRKRLIAKRNRDAKRKQRSRARHAVTPRGVRAESATPVPSRPVPSRPTEEKKIRSRSLRSLDTRARDENLEFNQFWNAYPRHEGKQDAWKAWTQAKLPPVETILGALAWQREQARWLEDNRRFVPHPATYLNHRRWEDERPSPQAAGTTARTAGNLTNIARGLGLTR
jgi:hypothetical protein